MSAYDWIMQFLVGGLFGAAGQGIRVVVGLKKLNDQSQRDQRPFGDLFRAGDLLVSLLIGFIAGVLGILAANVDIHSIKRETIMLLLGAGYAGTDFIEGFVKKYLPSGDRTDATGRPPVSEPPVG